MHLGGHLYVAVHVFGCALLAFTALLLVSNPLPLPVSSPQD
jgi:hypothetical protein